MKECDNSKIHISSNFILSISLLIMLDTLVLRPSLHWNTSLHFTTLHPTTLHYTYRHFTSSHLHFTTLSFGGTQWRSWLRHCATSWKVMGLIPDGVIGIFHLHNPSSHTMALGLTQPLTETSTRNISWGVKAAGA